MCPLPGPQGWQLLRGRALAQPAAREARAARSAAGLGAGAAAAGLREPGAFRPSPGAGKFCKEEGGGDQSRGEARFQRSLCEGSCMRPWRRPGRGRPGVPAAAGGLAASGPDHARRLGIPAEEGGAGEPGSRDLLFPRSLVPLREGGCVLFKGREPPPLCASLPWAPARERVMGGTTLILLRWRLPPCCGD